MSSIGSVSAFDTLRNLKRVDLAHLPTPIEPLDRLSAALGGPRIWVKRDDCTGLATGGNKTRKLEFLLADAQLKNADTVITVGAIQSNHARQVAAGCARLGFRCVLVLLDAVPHRAPVYRVLGNVLLDRLFGAEIRIVPEAENVGAVLDTIAGEMREQGRHPYVIPLGGSNGLGAIAYATAFLEAAEQLKELDDPPEIIVLPTVSGGTLAGLTLGAALAGWSGKIVGICAGDNAERAVQRVRAPQHAAAEILGLDSNDVAEIPVVVDDRFVGEGYGIPTSQSVQAIELLARTEGLLLDPVYTSKAMAGLCALVREHHFDPSVQSLLFWHTGGTVALHAYPDIFPTKNGSIET
jgi:D-cysteine desulfhydrase/L-cysteate sulfo-lyase